MGKRYRDDTTGPLSPLNDTIAIHQVNEVRGVVLRTFAIGTTSHRT